MGVPQGHLYQESLQARLAMLAAAAWQQPGRQQQAGQQQQRGQKHQLPGAGSVVTQAMGTTAVVAPLAMVSEAQLKAPEQEQALQPAPEVARALLDFCWRQLFGSVECTAPLRSALCRHLLLPLLQVGARRPLLGAADGHALLVAWAPAPTCALRLCAH
jgi:hypothetical protein